MTTKINNNILKVITGSSNILLILLTLLVVVEVISRKFFSYSFTFINPMTGLVFPWMIFLAIISVTANQDHIGVTYFRGLFPKKIQQILYLISRIFMLIFSIFMVISSYKLTSDVVHIIAPIINISRSWLYVSMVIAFVGTTLVLICQIIDFIKTRDIGDDYDDLGHDI